MDAQTIDGVGPSSVRVTVFDSPFGKRIDRWEPIAGRSVAELVREVGQDTLAAKPGADLRYMVDDLPLGEDGGRVPEPGQHVIGVLRPSGELIAAISIIIGWLAGPGLSISIPSLGVGLTVSLWDVVLFVAAVGLSVGVSYLTSALLAPDQPELGNAGPVSPALDIAGARNQATPYSVVPRIYGRWRYFPPLAARNVTFA